MALFGWIIQRIFTMARVAWVSAKGTAAEPFVWAMPTAMVGYFAWTFVEFEYAEKPFWEFLAMFTALCLMMGRGVEIPEWSLNDVLSSSKPKSRLQKPFENGTPQATEPV